MKHLDIKVPQSCEEDANLEASAGKAAILSNIEVATAIPCEKIKILLPLYKAEKVLITFVRAIIVIMSLALGFLMAGQVFLRYVIQSPFLGIEELAPLFALWVYFLGMAHATRERDHISGGILTLIFKKPALIHSIRMIGTILCIIAVVIFGYYSNKFALFNLKLGRTSIYMGYSKAFWDFSVVAGFVLVFFYFVLQSISEAQTMVKLLKKKVANNLKDIKLAA